MATQQPSVSLPRAIKISSMRHMADRNNQKSRSYRPSPMQPYKPPPRKPIRITKLSLARFQRLFLPTLHRDTIPQNLDFSSDYINLTPLRFPIKRDYDDAQRFINVNLPRHEAFKEEPLGHSPTCQGVIIRSSASSSSGNLINYFDPTNVNAMEAVLRTEDPPCEIPALVGYPIWIRNVNPSWEIPHAPTPAITAPINNVANYLTILSPSSTPNFGHLSKTWHGDVVVGRMDSQNLDPFDLKLLCYFCQWVLRYVIRDGGSPGQGSNGEGLSSQGETLREKQEKVFRKIATRENLDRYEDWYCKKILRVEC